MTATRNRGGAADGGDSRYDVGKAAILVPLIMGGAVVAAIVILWQAHDRKANIHESSRVEEMVRLELRNAYVQLRDMKPEETLRRTARAKLLLGSLHTTWPSDYVDLRIPLLLAEAEALFIKDSAGLAGEAEKRFDEAISLMTFASGEMWQFGMLGRARTSIEQGKYSEALADLDSILDRNSSFGAAYYWRALVRKNLGDADGAREDERRARGLDSWPPLRGFMQPRHERARDILVG